MGLALPITKGQSPAAMKDGCDVTSREYDTSTTNKKNLQYFSTWKKSQQNLEYTTSFWDSLSLST